MEFVELKNGMRAILVSDRNAHEAAVSTLVKTGSAWEGDTDGLAHFAEHMTLTAGTEEHPEENSFKSFVERAGGSMNGATEDFSTSFSMRVPNSALQRALPRFVDALTSRKQRFTEDLVRREIAAIHGEYNMWLNSERNLRGHALLLMAEPGSVERHFGCGNDKTLVPSEAVKVRKFIELYYCPRHMRLAIVSRLELEKLVTLFSSEFGTIDNHKGCLATLLDKDTLIEPFPVGQSKHYFYRARVQRELNGELHIYWPLGKVSDDDDVYRPWDYAAFALKWATRWGLRGSLRKLGLITFIDAKRALTSTGSVSPRGAQPHAEGAGRENLLALVDAVYAYIQKLRVAGVDEKFLQSILERQKGLCLQEFHVKSPQEEATSFAEQLAKDREPPRFLGPDDSKTSPSRAANLLQRITAENMRAVFFANDVEEVTVASHGDKARVHPWYGASLAMEEFPEGFVERLKSREISEAQGSGGPRLRSQTSFRRTDSLSMETTRMRQRLICLNLYRRLTP